MFKKAAILLLFLSIISCRVYAMNPNGPDEFASWIADGQKDIFPVALQYAGTLASNDEQDFSALYANAKGASKMYVALLAQGYVDAFEPAWNFAEKLLAYKGTTEVDISAFGGIQNFCYTDELQDALLQQTWLACWAVAAEIFKALTKHYHNKMIDIENPYGDGLILANAIFEITKKYTNHTLECNLYDSLNKQATDIYINLIGHDYEKAYKPGQEIAERLSHADSNLNSKICASLIYAELIKAKYNFDEVCAKSAEFAQVESDTSSKGVKRVPIIIYAALMDWDYQPIFEQAAVFILKNEYPGFNTYGFITPLIFNLCAGLIRNNVKLVRDYLIDYTKNLSQCALTDDNLCRILIPPAQPLIDALEVRGLLSNDDDDQQVD